MNKKNNLKILLTTASMLTLATSGVAFGTERTAIKQAVAVSTSTADFGGLLVNDDGMKSGFENQEIKLDAGAPINLGLNLDSKKTTLLIDSGHVTIKSIENAGDKLLSLKYNNGVIQKFTVAAKIGDVDANSKAGSELHLVGINNIIDNIIDGANLKVKLSGDNATLSLKGSLNEVSFDAGNDQKITLGTTSNTESVITKINFDAAKSNSELTLNGDNKITITELAGLTNSTKNSHIIVNMGAKDKEVTFTNAIGDVADPTKALTKLTIQKGKTTLNGLSNVKSVELKDKESTLILSQAGEHVMNIISTTAKEGNISLTGAGEYSFKNDIGIGQSNNPIGVVSLGKDTVLKIDLDKNKFYTEAFDGIADKESKVEFTATKANKFTLDKIGATHKMLEVKLAPDMELISNGGKGAEQFTLVKNSNLKLIDQLDGTKLQVTDTGAKITLTNTGEETNPVTIASNNLIEELSFGVKKEAKLVLDFGNTVKADGFKKLELTSTNPDQKAVLVLEAKLGSVYLDLNKIKNTDVELALNSKALILDTSDKSENITQKDFRIDIENKYVDFASTSDKLVLNISPKENNAQAKVGLVAKKIEVNNNSDQKIEVITIGNKEFGLVPLLTAMGGDYEAIAKKLPAKENMVEISGNLNTKNLLIDTPKVKILEVKNVDEITFNDNYTVTLSKDALKASSASEYAKISTITDKQGKLILEGSQNFKSVGASGNSIAEFKAEKTGDEPLNITVAETGIFADKIQMSGLDLTLLADSTIEATSGTIKNSTINIGVNKVELKGVSLKDNSKIAISVNGTSAGSLSNSKNSLIASDSIELHIEASGQDLSQKIEFVPFTGFSMTEAEFKSKINLISKGQRGRQYTYDAQSNKILGQYNTDNAIASLGKELAIAEKGDDEDLKEALKGLSAIIADSKAPKLAEFINVIPAESSSDDIKNFSDSLKPTTVGLTENIVTTIAEAASMVSNIDEKSGVSLISSGDEDIMTSGGIYLQGFTGFGKGKNYETNNIAGLIGGYIEASESTKVRFGLVAAQNAINFKKDDATTSKTNAEANATTFGALIEGSIDTGSNSFIDLGGSIGYSNIESTEYHYISKNNTKKAKGEYDLLSYGVSGALGYKVKPSELVDVKMKVGVSARGIAGSSFVQSGAGATDLEINNPGGIKILANLGLSLSYEVLAQENFSIIPQVYVEGGYVIHNSINTNVNYGLQGSTSLAELNLQAESAFEGKAGLMFNFKPTEGIASFGLGYQFSKIGEYNGHNFTIKAAVQF